MTPFEATEYIKSTMSVSTLTTSQKMAFEFAISALEKQIPKKVKEYSLGGFCCSSCGAIAYPTAAYCQHCGQALDWRDGDV